MNREWTLSQKLGAGFFVVVALTVVVALLAVRSLHSTIEAKDGVIDVHARSLILAQTLHAARASESAANRGYLLSASQRYLDQRQDAKRDFSNALKELKQLGEDQSVVTGIETASAANEQEVAKLLERRKHGANADDLDQAYEATRVKTGEALRSAIQRFIDRQEADLARNKAEATAQAESATRWLLITLALCIGTAAVLAFVLSRSLGRQIGGAIGHVQSSSAELQAAANQQATGAREQATAMAEITTTIQELLLTSRQIAESAINVSSIANQTLTSSRTGQDTLLEASESMAQIKTQVEAVVHHMLDLTQKTQRIGNVLEMVSELSEQTNILAINASIEAVGAGEAGVRFRVVADEIRKLADRVSTSAKEIRSLIEEVRGAVNATVMVTETGSKSVDAGSRQFEQVASAFKAIGSLVKTTTDAAKEIELSTKQQATAVEQVNSAISSVAQASKESEISSGQTLQTAKELTTLASDLSRIVRRAEVAPA
ncbi:MAG: methyl-accepting chemotaxis protein [Polyangiaceae bacterium]